MTGDVWREDVGEPGAARGKTRGVISRTRLQKYGTSRRTPPPAAAWSGSVKTMPPEIVHPSVFAAYPVTLPRP